MIRKVLPAASLLFCLLFSCAGKRPPEAPAGAGGGLSSSAEQVRFADDEGREIILDQPCGRIVSLYSAHTENLFAIGAGPLVCGVPRAADYPEEAAALPAFDYNGDPEYLIAASPGLVLIRPFIRRQAPRFIAELERAGITVVSLYPESLDSFDSYIRRLGLLSGRSREAEQQLAGFHAGLAGIEERSSQVTRKKTVFFEATENENRTVTPDSLPGRAIQFAGGLNIARNVTAITPGSSIAPFGAEKLLMSAEEIDVYVIQQGAMNRSANLAALRQRPGFGTIKAVREGKVLFISEKIISSPTFRYLEGVRALAVFLYPELFE